MVVELFFSPTCLSVSACHRFLAFMFVPVNSLLAKCQHTFCTAVEHHWLSNTCWLGEALGSVRACMIGEAWLRQGQQTLRLDDS